MLIISRKAEQAITIQGEITIKVLAIEGDRVKLGISAPADVRVLRSELMEEVRGENVSAQQTGKSGIAAIRKALAAQRTAGSPASSQADSPPSRL